MFGETFACPGKDIKYQPCLVKPKIKKEKEKQAYLCKYYSTTIYKGWYDK